MVQRMVAEEYLTSNIAAGLTLVSCKMSLNWLPDSHAR
jgi:hypothetical protein